MPRHEPATRHRMLNRRQLLTALPALAAGCGAAPQRPLTVGISIFPPHELAMLARDSGFFRDAGVEVRLVEFEDLSDAQRAFEQGKLDGLATTLVEVLVTRSSSPHDLRALRVIAVSDGADVLLAPRAVRNVAALRGRKVGVEVASLGHFLLLRALQKSGMTLSDVIPVSMAQHAMEAALAAGEVDAVVTYPPQAVPLRADPRWHPIFTSREIAQEVVHVYAFDGPTIARRSGEVTAFLRAVDRAFHRWSAEPVASCRTMAARGHLDADLFCAALQEGLRLVPPSGQADYLGPSMALRATVDSVQRALAQGGLIGAQPGLADCLEPFTP